MTPDVIYDQMIGCRRRPASSIFSLARQPGRRHRCTPIRRRIEQADPGAARDRGVLALRDGLPVRRRRVEPAVLPDPQLLRDRHPDGEPEHRADALAVRATATEVYVGAAAQARRRRSCTPSAPTAGGDTQIWGLLGCQKEAAFAAERVIVVVRGGRRRGGRSARDPNRTVIPGIVVDAVVERAVRVPSERSRRATTTATTPSTSSGSGSRSDPGALERVAEASGSTAWRATPTTSRRWATSVGRPAARRTPVRRGQLR